MASVTPDSEEIKNASTLLKAGQLVAFPTETVYGLGADASNTDALARLYRVKGRPDTHPVIVHLASVDMLEKWAKTVPDEAYKLAEKLWPGPMTLILKKASHVSDAVSGGQDTVGLRIPSHPVALELLKEFGSGVAAPSANRHGKVSPTSAAHVKEELGDLVAKILDGGPCSVGIESTIIDLSGQERRILRPGMITIEEIEKILGKKKGKAKANQEEVAPRAPGTLSSHYAPSTSLKLFAPSNLGRALATAENLSMKVAVMSFREPITCSVVVTWRQLPDNADEYARVLYSTLRELDEQGADYIIAEEPPQKTAWSGILDRLRRAANG